MAIAWEVNLVYDILILGLTTLKLYKEREYYRVRGGNCLLTHMVKDGMFYPILSCSSNG